MCDINLKNQEYFESLNNFIKSDKKILLLDSQSLRNAINLLHLLENEYSLSEIFENTNSVSEFLFLLKQQYNPKKQKYELNAYFNHQVSEHFSFNFLLKTTANLFRPDIVSYTNQIEKIIKKMNYSKIAIIMNMKENFCDEMIELLQTLCKNESLEIKFVVIYNSNNVTFIDNLLELNNYVEKIHLDYPISCLLNSFSKLSKDEINLLISLTNNDIYEMQNIYPYLVESDECSFGDKDYLKNKITQKIAAICTAEEKYVLGIASYFIDRFTQEKINTIINIDERINKITDLASIINIAIQDKFLEYKEQDYGFYTEFIQTVFSDLNKDNRTLFNNVIEKYLQKYHPFDYSTRRAHLRMSNDDREKEMIAMQVIHCLHFYEKINEVLKNEFIAVFDENTFNVLISTFDCIEKGEYLKNYYSLTNLDDFGSQVLSNEIEYLLLFLEWKLSDIKKSEHIETDLISLLNSDCELEQKIFVLLLKLSIVSNGKDNIFKSERPVTIFKEIYSILSSHKSVEFDYLINILYRKSNSAKFRVPSISLVKQSFKYFTERKELYSKQYFMAGNNYIALLLQSVGDKNQSLYKTNNEIFECDDPYYIADTLLNELSIDSFSDLYVYIKSNYLLASELLNKDKFNENDLLQFIDVCKNTNISTQIMIYINVGTLFAIHGNLQQAKLLWEKASQLNITNDTYYEYILKNNLFIANIVSENSTIMPFNSIDTSIFQDDNEINQYYNLRNKLLNNLYVTNKHCSYIEICSYFEKEFYDKLEKPLKLFSTPYLLPDIQFWSEN